MYVGRASCADVGDRGGGCGKAQPVDVVLVFIVTVFVFVTAAAAAAALLVVLVVFVSALLASSGTVTMLLCGAGEPAPHSRGLLWGSADGAAVGGRRTCPRRCGRSRRRSRTATSAASPRPANHF